MESSNRILYRKAIVMSKLKGSIETQIILANAIRHLMVYIPLDYITVTAIVRHCGMTRQNFYRYFHNKYELVMWYYEKLIRETKTRVSKKIIWEDALHIRLQLMCCEKKFYISIFSSKVANEFLHYEYNQLKKMMCIDNNANGELNSELIMKISSIIMYWAKDGMIVSPEQIMFAITKLSKRSNLQRY